MSWLPSGEALWQPLPPGQCFLGAAAVAMGAEARRRRPRRPQTIHRGIEELVCRPILTSRGWQGAPSLEIPFFLLFSFDTQAAIPFAGARGHAAIMNAAHSGPGTSNPQDRKALPGAARGRTCPGHHCRAGENEGSGSNRQAGRFRGDPQAGVLGTAGRAAR